MNERNLNKGELTSITNLFKLVKSVYSNNISILNFDGLEILVDNELLTNKDSEELFKNSFFSIDKSSEMKIPEEYLDAIFVLSNFIEASKDRVKVISIDNNKIILSGGKSDKKFEVGIKMDNKDKIANKFYPIFENYKSFEGINKDKIATRIITNIDIDKLLDYQVVTFRPDDTTIDGVGLILTRKGFPNIKKLILGEIFWDMSKEINEEMLSEVFSTYSIDHLNVNFICLLKVLSV